jgi:hypothetical protein
MHRGEHSKSLQDVVATHRKLLSSTAWSRDQVHALRQGLPVEYRDSQRLVHTVMYMPGVLRIGLGGVNSGLKRHKDLASGANARESMSSRVET